MITYNKETSILLVAMGNEIIIRMVYSILQRFEPQRLYVFYKVPANKEQETVQERLQSLLTGDFGESVPCIPHESVPGIPRESVPGNPVKVYQ